jgi:hypothetical protein
MVKITLKDIENNIIGGSPLALLLTADPYTNIFDFSLKEPHLTINRNELPNPFSPRFKMLIDKEENDYATLKIKRRQIDVAPKFDYFMTVEARADIDYTVNF